MQDLKLRRHSTHAGAFPAIRNRSRPSHTLSSTQLAASPLRIPIVQSDVVKESHQKLSFHKTWFPKRAQRTHAIPNGQPVNFIDHRRPDARLCISCNHTISSRRMQQLKLSVRNSGRRFPVEVAWRWSPWRSDEVISLAGVDTVFKFTKHGRCELKSNRPGAFTEMHFHGLRRALSAWRPTTGCSGKSSRSSDIEQEVTNVTVLHHV